MNKTILALLVLSAPASAQVVSNIPGSRGSIIVGTGVNLPGPIGSAVITPRISLPAPVLTPALTILPAPVVAYEIPVLPATEIVAIKPLALPAKQPAMPVALPSAIPPSALTLHLAAASKAEAPVPPVTKEQLAQRERLDDLFDGRGGDRRERADQRGPIRSGRHVSLPENELEREIGAY